MHRDLSQDWFWPLLSVCLCQVWAMRAHTAPFHSLAQARRSRVPSPPPVAPAVGAEEAMDTLMALPGPGRHRGGSQEVRHGMCTQALLCPPQCKGKESGEGCQFLRRALLSSNENLWVMAEEYFHCGCWTKMSGAACPHWGQTLFPWCSCTARDHWCLGASAAAEVHQTPFSWGVQEV